MTIISYEEAIRRIGAANAELSNATEESSAKELGDIASKVVDFLHPVATGNIKH